MCWKDTLSTHTYVLKRYPLNTFTAPLLSRRLILVKTEQCMSILRHEGGYTWKA